LFLARAFPKAAGNKALKAPNSVLLVVAVDEKSFFASVLMKFVEDYRAKGMAEVEGACILAPANTLWLTTPRQSPT
jgi:hypothetical protein